MQYLSKLHSSIKYNILLAFFNIYLFFVYGPYFFGKFKFFDALNRLGVSYYGPQQHFNYNHYVFFQIFVFSCILSVLIFAFILALPDKRKLQYIILILFLIMQTLLYQNSLDVKNYVILIILSIFSSIIVNKADFSPPAKLRITLAEFLNLNVITIVIFIVAVFIYLGSYVHYHSFHFAEMTVWGYFGDIKQTPTQFVVRHGMFELLLQKGLASFGLYPELTAHISMFIVKFFSYTSVLLVAYLVFLLTNSLWLTLLYLLLYRAISFNPEIYANTIIVPFLLLSFFDRKECYRKIIAPFLGFTVGFIYFMRVDVGLFVSIASCIAIILYRNVKYFIWCLAGLVVPFGIYSTIWGINSLKEFIITSTILQAKYNNLVWGIGPINLISDGLVSGRIMAQYLFLVIGIYLGLKHLMKNDKNVIPFVFLILISAASFTILLGRIDRSRQFQFSSFLLALPFVLFFIQNNKKRILNLFFLPLIIMLIVALPSFQLSNLNLPAKHLFSPHIRTVIQNPNILKHQTKDAPEVRLADSYIDIIQNNKNKVSFFPFNGFLYLYYNTRPVGKYTDSYQVYPLDNPAFNKQILDSEYIFWFKTNLDGVPDEKRLQNQLCLIRKHFKIVDQKEDALFVYKKINNPEMF